MQIGDGDPAGIAQAILGLHLERTDTGEGCLSEALARQATQQDPISQLHIRIGAAQAIGDIEAF